MTNIKQCTPCKTHEYQDKKYGKNMRVCNSVPNSKTDKIEYRCTICGKK